MSVATDQFPVRARAALVAKWPELERYDQGELLRVLEDSYKGTTTILTDQKAAKPQFGPEDIPPSLDAVAEFLSELGSDLDAQDFYDFYTSKSWKIGKSPMKDWHAAARRAHRLWDRPGRKPKEELTEWEIKTKTERLQSLQQQLKELRYPGGCAWPVNLAGEPLRRAQGILDQINSLKTELGHV